MRECRSMADLPARRRPDAGSSAGQVCRTVRDLRKAINLSPPRHGESASSQPPDRSSILKLSFTKLSACVAIAIGLLSTAQAQMPRTPSVPGAKLYIAEPVNGASIKGPVRVVMGLSGMGVAPAGADFPETGHHHILVNADATPAVDMPIPADDKHRHFGKGQTEATLTLPPGKHTLQLLLGDKNHVPHNPPLLSEKITITVLP